MKFALFADGAPSTIAPPAEIIPLPVGSRDAMFAADKATIAPSGTEVPLISLIFVMVSVVAPGVVPFTTTVVGLVVIVAECATYCRSAGVMIVYVPTNWESLVKTAVVV